MTVNQLIEALSALDDSDKACEVYIAIRQYNKRYPVAYTPIISAGGGSVHGQIRLVTTLPDKVYTASKDPNFFTV